MFMCTSPVTIYRPLKFNNGCRLDTVPCGKCDECRSIKRNAIATTAVVQASRSNNLHLLTFTYNNDKVRLALTPRVVNTDGEILAEYPYFFPDELPDRNHLISLMIDAYRRSDVYNPDSPNGILPISYKAYDIDDDTFVEYRVTPSLDRLQWRLWLKRFRIQYERKHNGKKLSDFKYVCFGEYGDCTARPHVHALFTGLSDSEIFEMSLSWSRQFGHLDHVKVKRFNLDGSPGFVKASKYISKYIGKEHYSLQHDLEGYVEKPRKHTSIGFGALTPKEVEKYRKYYLCKDYRPDNINLLFNELLNRRFRFAFDGETLVMPQSYIKSIFYEKFISVRNGGLKKRWNRIPFGPDEWVGVLPPDAWYKETKVCYRPLPLYSLALDYQRNENHNNFIRLVRENSASDSFEDFTFSAREVIAREKIALENRKSAAAKNLLIGLKCQKYA